MCVYGRKGWHWGPPGRYLISLTHRKDRQALLPPGFLLKMGEGLWTPSRSL